MFGIENYASFIVAIILFQVIPGPGTITILNATARHGIGMGLRAVLGTLLGDLVYMVAAVAGLAAVMKANSFLFEALQWGGALYLCLVGLQLLRSSRESHGASPAADSGKLYARQAFAVSLTNPKVILFFVGFFPLFLRPDSSPATMLAMMLHVTLISLCYQSGLVLAGNAVARKLKSLPAVRKLATQLAGAVLVGFAIKLAAGNR